jgi:Sec-independent protein translocase protein TatA
MLILAVVLIVLFGSKKLPDAARSPGPVDAHLEDRS